MLLLITPLIAADTCCRQAVRHASCYAYADVVADYYADADAAFHAKMPLSYAALITPFAIFAAAACRWYINATP